jgi:hypothetical protein
VLRGGFGITNDPYSLARSMRTNHPILENLYDEAEHSFTWVRPIEQGLPLIPDSDLRNGIIPVPGNVTVICRQRGEPAAPRGSVQRDGTGRISRTPATETRTDRTSARKISKESPIQVRSTVVIDARH